MCRAHVPAADALTCELAAAYLAPRVQFMGVEIPAEHGGTESNFMSAILLIEELAKVRLAPAPPCPRAARHLAGALSGVAGTDRVRGGDTCVGGE